jgi:hypothetical protein
MSRETALFRVQLLREVKISAYLSRLSGAIRWLAVPLGRLHATLRSRHGVVGEPRGVSLVPGTCKPLSTQTAQCRGTLGSRRLSGGSVLPRQFASQKALLDYAEQKGLVYVWAYTRHERVAVADR